MTETPVTRRFENLFKRVLVAVVAIPVIVWAALVGSYWFFALVAVLSAFSLYEFYKLMGRKGAFPLVGLGLFTGLLVNVTFIYERLQLDLYQFFLNYGISLRMFSQLQLFLVIEILFVLVVLLVELFRTRGSASLNIATTLAGVMVVSLNFGLLIRLRELFPYGFPVHQFMGSSLASDEQLQQINSWGGFTVLSLLVSIWMCDTAAYFAGSSWGKHKLFPRVSPGKSWEGAAAGLVAAIATMIVARIYFLEYLSMTHAVVLGVFIGVFGQLGDLVESRFKRDADVKDSSALIPGHGGVYDRFDSLVFVAPIVYLYIDFIVLS
jgi:phosphatidate cytidylyltransferase